MSYPRSSSTPSDLIILQSSDGSEPFFFEGGGRSKTLHRIVHCMRYNPGVIFLMGPTGSGRSILLKKLQQLSVTEESDFCLLGEDCMVLETEEELYSVLAKGFGLEDKALEILEDLVERVQHFIAVSLQQKRQIVIAVDDALQHSMGVLGALLQLASSNKGLSIVLTGENNLSEILKEFHLDALLIHQIMLRPLLTEEVQEFVSQKSSHNGLQNSSRLDQKAIEELMSRTGGNMSLLVRETRQKMPASKTPRFHLVSRFPMLHLTAMAIVVGLTLTAFFYYPDAKVIQEIAVSEVALSFSESAVPPVIEAPVIPTSEVAVEQTADDPVLAEEREEPEKSDAPISYLEAPVYSQQEQELLNRPAEHITLQILSLSEEKKIVDFVMQQSAGDQEQLRYYRRGTGEKLSFVLVYGDYPDKQTASTATKMLPMALAKGSPWPRPLADVQRDIQQGQK